MSDYPNAQLYGANYPGQQPNAPYPPPYPNNTYTQTESGYQGPPQYAQNYDASANAYGYNQHATAGYGGAGPAPSGVPPGFQGWHQNPTSLPTYTNTQGGMAYSNYAGGAYSSAPQYPAEIRQSYPQHLQYNLGDESDAKTADYDDAYAPTNPSLVSYGTTQYLGAGGSGYLNSVQRSSAYSGAQNQTPVQSSQSNNDYYPRETTHVGHQPSGSYSQYNSAPGVVDPNGASGTDRSYNTYSSNQVAGQGSEQYLSAQPSINQSTWDQNGSVNTSISNSRTNFTHAANPQDKSFQHTIFSTTTPSRPNNFAPSAETSTTPSRTPIQPAGQTTDTKAHKTLVEARKEAEAAVLNLYPFQVGFRNFVDEGFDEHIVGRVFDNLGLTRSPSAKSAIESQLSPNHSTTKQASGATISIETSVGNNKQAPSKGPLDPQPSFETVQVNSQDQENRPLNKPATHPLSATATAPAPPPKPSAPTEKERKLQMKMEALRKSREQRAQKAAVPPANPPAATEKLQQLHSKMEALRKSREHGTQNVAAANQPSIPSSITLAPLPGAKQADRFEPSAPKNTPGAQAANTIPEHIGAQVPAVAHASQSTTQPTIAHRGPPIPGLFLSPTATSSAQTAPTSNVKNGPAVGIHRKRPVAADFDTPTSTASLKRPFGQSRYETPLVINVTDEEQDSDDDDMAMEIESSADHNSPVLSARNVSDQRNASMQNLAVITNLAARKPFTPPPVSSASSTPTTRKSTLGKPEVLQEKEFAIEALRKRIAEAEAAKALKRAKRVADGTGTPRTTDSSGDDTKSIDKDMAKKIEASIQIQQKLDTAEVTVSLDQKRLAEAQAAEIKKVAELEQSEADQTRLRREQISTELPRVDAEVQKNQLKLELLRSEIARIESAVQQKLEEKQNMADELERLGQEAEERLQAEKDKLQSLTSTEVPIASDSRGQTQSPAIEMDVDGSSSPAPIQLQPSLYPSEHSHAASEAVDQLHNRPASSSSEPESQLGAVPTKESDIPHEQSTVRPDNYTASESHGQQTERMESASASPAEAGNTSVNDPLALRHSRSVSESVSTPMEVDSRSPSYSPVLDRTLIVASEREDDYEPPDATPPVDVPSVAGSPPFSPAPPKAIIGDTLENNTMALEPAANEDVTEAAPTKVNGEVLSLSNEDAKQLTKPTQVFTPYESPLKRFHAFRFHPEFGREVPGGLRSLTYSHKIDPMTELCPWEMAGGACNDETCEYQHIRDIRLPDDDILKFLGSQDGFTGDDRVRFIDGLKDALGAIRERKIRDFDTIAQEILAYRRRFLGDSSKVLALAGTAI